MPVDYAGGYPKRSGKVKGRKTWRMHKGGKKYTTRQMRAYFATGGWSRPVRKKRKGARKRRR